jgi:hypothetical protein
VPRRLLLTIAALALVASAGLAGCADSVNPAVRIGDDATITHDDLLGEVAAWAGSPTLLDQLQIPILPGNADDGFDMGFVNIVLSNRIAFALHNQEFEARGLELTEAELEEARSALMPGVTEELGDPYGEELVADIARQFRVQAELADGYAAWAQESFTRRDIEVSTRYGGWDPATGTVLAPQPPTGPASADSAAP